MRRITNDLGIDNIIATWLASNSYSGKKQGKCISATTLLRSTQQQVLGYRCMNSDDYIEQVDISTLLKSQIGTALHKSIQDTWESKGLRENGLINLGISPEKIAKIKVNPENPNPDDYNLFFEKRVEKEFKGWTITGQFDLVCNGNLHDFKSTSTYTYVNKTKEKDYILQGSIYRWLNPELITGDFITIHYIFTDWNKNYTLSNPDYPKCPFVSVKLPLMSIAEIETFMSNKIMGIEAYLEEENLPECDAKTLMIDEVWQYFSSNNALRASKNFNSLIEANAYLLSKGGKGVVKKKTSEPKGCSYCSCRNVCKQYKRFVSEGLIKE